MWAMNTAKESSRALSMTLMSSAVSGGSFISTYFMVFCSRVGAYIPLFETETEKTFLVGVIICIIIGILTAVKNFAPAEKKAAAQ